MSASTSPETDAERRVHEVDGQQDPAQDGGDTLGTPLDMLLSEASSSPLRRFVRACPGSG